MVVRLSVAGVARGRSVAGGEEGRGEEERGFFAAAF